MDLRCHIEMLGGLRVVQGERVISHFRTRKTAALLAYLAYHYGPARPREELVDLLWPASEPSAGRINLSVALSSLRRQLEPRGVPPGAFLQVEEEEALCLLLPPLLQALQDPEPGLRETAIGGLGALAARSRSERLRADVHWALTGTLQDRHPGVRRVAAAALAPGREVLRHERE